MIPYHVLIPAYNAEHTLPILLSQLQKLREKPISILVIDDGSSDATSAVVKEFKVEGFKFPQNRGKGRALRHGFNMLLENTDADYIVCLDADLQHPVSFIPVFINEAENKNSWFVMGYRHQSISVMPWSRILSNFITSQIISGLTGQKIRDSQCGFRLIAKSVLREINLQEDGFQLESEMLLRIATRKIRIDQVAIPTIYNHDNSHIHHFKDTIKFIVLIIKEIGYKLRCSLKNKKQK